MIKTHSASRFELKTLEGIRDSADVILQAQETGSTFEGENAFIFARLSDLMSTGKRRRQTSWRKNL